MSWAAWLFLGGAGHGGEIAGGLFHAGGDGDGVGTHFLGGGGDGAGPGGGLTRAAGHLAGDAGEFGGGRAQNAGAIDHVLNQPSQTVGHGLEGARQVPDFVLARHQFRRNIAGQVAPAHPIQQVDADGERTADAAGNENSESRGQQQAKSQPALESQGDGVDARGFVCRL
jgi:hypothetical protein